MGPLGTMYETTHRRVVELLAGLTEDDAELPVPATPGWSVHDLVAHMSGVVDDAVNDRMAGAPGDAWTAAQIERGRSIDVAGLVERWNRQLPDFLAVLDGSGRWPAAFDLVTHEHDLRHALGRPGRRGGDEIAALARMLVAGIDADLTIDTESGRLRGSDDARVGLRTTDFEVVRSRFGRRTRRELEAGDWRGEPEHVAEVLDRWFIFGPATERLGE